MRKAIQVENLYPFGTYKYEHLADDSLLKSKNIKLNKNAEMYRLKARISGHGHAGPFNCCEWDSKTHTYYINEEENFRWNVWKDCGFNPIYPQGGTWPFDRAGWCLGTKIDEYNFELTPMVKSGDSLNIDYGIENYCDNGEKRGEFQMTHQLISYGEPNFKNDAEISGIIAPTTKGEHKRINPICSNPVIEIKNTGIHNLKKVRIKYGIKNGEELIIKWHGDLKFLEKEEVTLPCLDWSVANEGSLFYAEIIDVNNSKDECSFNNRAESKYVKPVQLPKNFIDKKEILYKFQFDFGEKLILNFRVL